MVKVIELSGRANHNMRDCRKIKTTLKNFEETCQILGVEMETITVDNSNVDTITLLSILSEYRDVRISKIEDVVYEQSELNSEQNDELDMAISSYGNEIEIINKAEVNIEEVCQILQIKKEQLRVENFVDFN